MSDRAINISLGSHDNEQRKASLRQLAAAVNAIGRNGVPSISEMLCRLADAYGYEPETVASYVIEIMRLAAAAQVVDAEGL